MPSHRLAEVQVVEVVIKIQTWISKSERFGAGGHSERYAFSLEESNLFVFAFVPKYYRRCPLLLVAIAHVSVAKCDVCVMPLVASMSSNVCGSKGPGVRGCHFLRR